LKAALCRPARDRDPFLWGPCLPVLGPLSTRVVLSGDYLRTPLYLRQRMKHSACIASLYVRGAPRCVGCSSVLPIALWNFGIGASVCPIVQVQSNARVPLPIQRIRVGMREPQHKRSFGCGHLRQLVRSLRLPLIRGALEPAVWFGGYPVQLTVVAFDYPFEVQRRTIGQSEWGVFCAVHSSRACRYETYPGCQ